MVLSRWRRLRARAENRHNSTNVITCSVVKREHRRRRGARGRKGNYTGAHVTDAHKKCPNKSSRDASGARMEAKRELLEKPNQSATKRVARSARQNLKPQMCVMCVSGCGGTGAGRAATLMTGPCRTTRTKSANNDDKPSGKWTRARGAARNHLSSLPPASA